MEAQEVSWELKQELFPVVRKWINENTREKNSDGVKIQQGRFSRVPVRIDDATYRIAVHINTAHATEQETERLTLTLKKQDGGWQVDGAESVEKINMLVRSDASKCYKFDRMTFDREGLRMSASNGDVCETYVEGQVAGFAVQSADLSYSYEPPDHATRFPDGRHYRKSHQVYKQIHTKELSFDPQIVFFQCDPETCEALLSEALPGLERVPPEERAKHVNDLSDPARPAWAQRYINETAKDRRQNPFNGFNRREEPGHEYYSVFISRELNEPQSGVRLAYDNWNEFDIVFSVWPKRFDLPNQIVGPLYGYYLEETLASVDAYDLERRQGGFTRWLEIQSVKGNVDLAVEEPELLRGDIEYKLGIKQDMDLVPFFISTFDPTGRSNSRRPAPFSVDSVRLDGEELTWVQVGRYLGLAVLPEGIKADTTINLGLSYSSRGIYDENYSFKVVDRHSWLPFNRLGDYIEEYDLVIRSPAKFEIYGSGKKVEDRVEGDLRITHWVAEKPVNGPSVVFGTYVSNSGTIEAKTLDGKTIPVAVHVDKASAADWDITEASLTPIVNSAINSINLYTKVSGFEYPFDELHIINDPQGLLYGEARSGVIYLGQGVFKGEASLAPYFIDSTGIARFLRSVVPHEVGHMWWGEGITFHNTRNWWFIETMPEYFSALYLELANGYDDYQKQVDEWRRNILTSNLNGSVQNANTLFAGAHGGGSGEAAPRTAAIYSKGPYALHMLRETFKGEGPRGPGGADKKFFEFLREFSLTLREKGEVVTTDIQIAAEQALGGLDEQGNRYNADLSWFFDQWVRGVGIPQYEMDYGIRRNEEGNFLIEGVIKQQILLGTSEYVLEESAYRGFVDLTVKTKKDSYLKRLVINNPETPFRVVVPAKPLEVLLNNQGEMLAHDIRTN
ncbi:MAG: hypothetical protein GTN89_13380 [Acidobacteria bacterium]|nr:hypothetical protein [Acidobacteriota bacterium]NIM60239.1 hypothetical protein [Acidobacteriota bacterium]NIO60277.1 hypothetical protein [Acidobacteriota bacterium]NIQ31332.1 hypothetical protein [Acidobacteriota bacterium]NIQ86555.1 hypothetical protein [Acidobacteriota bacterium]